MVVVWVVGVCAMNTCCSCCGCRLLFGNLLLEESLSPFSVLVLDWGR